MILNYRLLLPLILASTAFSVHAEERWFEVELLLFQRNTDITSTKEELVVKNLNIDTRKSIPLLKTELEGTCKPEEVIVKKPSQGIEFLDDNEEVSNGVEYLTDDNAAYTDTTKIIKAPCVPKKISEIPVLVDDSIFDAEKNGFQLLANDKLQLTPQREKLTEHASFKPLLHLAWRMPVDSKAKALPIHLIAGEDLSLPMPSDELSNTPPEPKWTIDGNFKIYVDHYLFIDSQLIVRQKVTQDIPLETNQETIEDIDGNVQIIKQNELINPVSTHKKTVITESLFDQNRRLRSGEIHYFDHPLMGMIVQIRKIPKNELAALKSMKVTTHKKVPIKKKATSYKVTKIVSSKTQSLQEMKAAQDLIDANKSEDFMDE